ncbi:hypothetical protein BDV33DRAFT_199042 [Aspergillus novoparasiticus]|uniref:Uncharacterized protein n=1 Tax=Aspergillus novoparasiticus TaxID=986946 RepID=A0A5N6F829_9EURO|nr:hypothetical protein BDV33DRAFT_199042 [Aspergillus novoparasiticus]
MAPFGSLQPRPDHGLGRCGICREWIGPQLSQGGREIRAADIFESSGEWKVSVEKHGYVSGHVLELQKTYFRHPWFWTWIYRALIYNRSTDTFRLTGVGFAREVPNGLIQLPVASNQFYISLDLIEREGIKLTEAFPVNITYGMIAEWDFHGIAVHERCWTLTTRLLGMDLVKTHLKEFVEAIPRSWYMGNHNQCMTDVLLDVHCWSRWKVLALPPELIIQIMDILPGSREIRLLLWAYPPWGPKVPWSYWRTRFRKDLMLDMDDLPDIDKLDWQHAYYSIERLYSTSHGLHSRKRVLRCIENIKTAFMDGLQKKRELTAMSKASPLH